MSSWVVTRHADCIKVLRDSEHFARDRRRVGIEVPERLQNLQSLDPPHLSPLKRVLTGALRTQDLPRLGERSRLLVERLFANLRHRKEFDWIHEVAAPVALAVSADLFGVPAPDLEQYSGISDRIARRMDGGLNPSVVPAGDAARAELDAMVRKWFTTTNQYGALSTIRAEAYKARVPEHYIRNSVSNMFNASYGTLFAAIGNVALVLLQHPETLEELAGNPALLDTAPDEFVRFDGPAQGTSRVSTGSTVLAGQSIEPGQIVLTLFGAANRDPAEFPDPERLVLDRSPNRHLGFGWGVHSCIGTVFGNLVIKEMLAALVAAPRMRLTGRPVRRTTATVRSMDFLPVAFRTSAEGVGGL
jgi:cytochrome P450